LHHAPVDWEAEGRVEARNVVVQRFWLDDIVVVRAAYDACVQASLCPPASVDSEPDQPVRGVSPGGAEAYCQSKGGRLPTSDEWRFAAAGSEARRFPWGQTGLVCRRAVFGLRSGPCATGGEGPDVPRSRPSGATPSGLFDMAGNLAEWTRDAGGHVARGGSYASSLAGALKSWAVSPTNAKETIGFRCAYRDGRESLPP
jgi:formylglycine-generating enzyme required for sulfatase activity